ncbi:outer membrane protein assembly factor BamE [Pseudovibrio brasiliensis]|uniref:Outer membrane protein assembly factor BamE n=1 Tax=Pseudovibrio brasiliensis TaxID=1898042 RepID=A0ABX8ARN3_9HYPH|nr:outer membrane protein assembly factor BamE [Pseudovibrio brasiliensis]
MLGPFWNTGQLTPGLMGITLRFTKIMISVALAASLAACASVGNENIRKETAATVATKLTKGKTTKDDVAKLFGSPDTVDFSDSGNEIWKYQHVRSQPKVENFIPVVDILAGGQDLQKKELALFFNSRGVLKNYTMLETDSEVRTGLINANQ